MFSKIFRSGIPLLVLVFFVPQNTYAQLQINELLAVNSTIAHDPDFGEFSDFVELRNASATVPSTSPATPSPTTRPRRTNGLCRH
jgi:hypothetical protein